MLFLRQAVTNTRHTDSAPPAVENLLLTMSQAVNKHYGCCFLSTQCSLSHTHTPVAVVILWPFSMTETCQAWLSCQPDEWNMACVTEKPVWRHLSDFLNSKGNKTDVLNALLARWDFVQVAHWFSIKFLLESDHFGDLPGWVSIFIDFLLNSYQKPTIMGPWLAVGLYEAL